VDVTQERANSYRECRFFARQRKLDSAFSEDVIRAHVIFSYREPSVIEQDNDEVYSE